MRPQSEAPDEFDAPWQAEAYGIGQALIEAGHVSSDQWAKALSAALRRKLQEECLPDNAETYSDAVVEALRQVISENDLLPESDIEQRVEDWRSAYLRTPHGHPVKLT